MLTRKQQELLFFIHDSMKKNGISPSFDEMKEALDLASKSGIHRLITALEERGFIRRLPNRARALEIVKLPQPNFSAIQKQTKLSPSIINNDKKFSVVNESKSEKIHNSQKNHTYTKDSSESMVIPLMGRIAAGVPITAIQQKTNNISCPNNMISQGEHYALEVKGDSMINAGILNNDIVIIRQTDTAAPGSIVVALVDDTEATLKYYRRKGNSIALEAANPDYETRIFGPDRIKIQGQLVGLLRNY